MLAVKQSSGITEHDRLRMIRLPLASLDLTNQILNQLCTLATIPAILCKSERSTLRSHGNDSGKRLCGIDTRKQQSLRLDTESSSVPALNCHFYLQLMNFVVRHAAATA
jgi:hypothetical protein